MVVLTIPLRRTKFVTLPLQDVSHIERVGLDELHLVTPRETYKVSRFCGR